MAPLSSLDFGQMPLSRGASLTWSSDYEPDVKPIIIIIIMGALAILANVSLLGDCSLFMFNLVTSFV